MGVGDADSMVESVEYFDPKTKVYYGFGEVASSDGLHHNGTLNSDED
jgi:hypothetical protein